MHTISRIKHLMADVQTPGEYERKQSRFGHPQPDRRPERPEAEVNGGRWLVRCPFCHNAMLGDPEWQETFCFECGRAYRPIYPPPPVVVQIDQALEVRPSRASQNWLPSETVDDLLAENLEHGLGPGVGG